MCENSNVVEFGGEDMLRSLIKQDEERKELETRMSKIESLNNAVHQALDKERHTTQVLMIALVVMLVICLWALI
jgi:hypothetical protein